MRKPFRFRRTNMTNRQDEELLLVTVENYWPFGTNINTNTIHRRIKFSWCQLDQYSTMLAHIRSPCFEIYSLQPGKISPHNAVVSLSSCQGVCSLLSIPEMLLCHGSSPPPCSCYCSWTKSFQPTKEGETLGLDCSHWQCSISITYKPYRSSVQAGKYEYNVISYKIQENNLNDVKFTSWNKSECLW